MRTLSASLSAELARNDGPRFRLLLHIDAPDLATRRLCTDTRTIGIHDYTGKLLNVSPIYEGIDQVGDLSIELADTWHNRNSAMLAATVWLGLWAVGSDLADASTVFKGEISDPVDRSGGRIRFDVISHANRHDRRIGAPLSEADYPGADPDVLGKIMPEYYGSHTDVPCLPIDAGALDTLALDIDDIVDTLPLSDAVRFPSSGTIQIGYEQITYAGIADNNLTGCTRGANSTTAAAHQKGAQVGEVKTQYDYLVANHPATALSNVKVNGVLQEGTDFTLLTDDNGQAKIRFTTLPKLERSVDIEISDDIEFSASQGPHAHALFNATSNTTQYTTEVNHVIDDGQTGNYLWQIPWPAMPGGVVGGNTTLSISSDASFGAWEVRHYTGPGQYQVVASGSISDTVTFGVVSDDIWIANLSNYHRDITITDAYRDIEYNVDMDDTTPGITTNKTSGVSANSAADIVIGGLVTCDIDGHLDDASGTITGTADALIERPDHIARHLLRHYGQATDAETDASDFDVFTGDRLAIRIASQTSVRPLLREIARQSRGIANYSAGRWRFIRRPDPDAAPAITLNGSDLVRNEEGAPTAQEGRAGVRSIYNRHTWRAGLQAGGGWAHNATQDDTTSQDRYGLRDTTVDLPFVPDAAQAQALIDWMATRDTDPERKIVSVTAKLTAHVLEVGDLVRLDTLRANIDINAEVVAIGPRILSGQGAGRLQLTLETIRDNNAPLVDMPLQTSLVMRKGTGVATFTNASTTRTYIQDGILKYAAVNEPRFEKNGLLMEGPRTNYLTSSSDFVNPGWSKVAGVNVTPSDALAPDGTLSASKVEDLNSTDWSYIQRVGAVVDDTAPRTASLFIEKDDNEARFPLLRLGYYGGDITYGDLSVNTKTGEIFSKHNTIRANISDENPNYWRVEFTVVNNGTGNNGCYLGVFPAASATLGGAYSTTINGSIHAWGSQVEDGDFASSYIPTDTAPATRSQDQLWIPHTDNISETVNGHFSILADVNLLGYDDVAQAVYWVEGEQWRVLYASVAASGSGDEPTMFKQNGFPISGEERIPLHEVHRLAHVFDGTQQQMYLDGRLLISNNNVATTGTPNKISIGCANIGNRELFGHLKNFRIYGEALSPEQMKVS